MNSFEWLELDNLSQEVAGLEDHLCAARKTGNHGLLKLLEYQLDEADKRRTRLLGLIARQMATPSTAHAPYLRSAYRIG
jgi:hypothetical protein